MVCPLDHIKIVLVEPNLRAGSLFVLHTICDSVCIKVHVYYFGSLALLAGQHVFLNETRIL